MFGDEGRRQRLSRRALFSIGAPILGLVLLVTAGAFAVFINFAQQQDRSNLAGERHLAANVVHERLRNISDIVLEYAAWDDAYAAIAQHWNANWISSNFYSSVVDAFVIFDETGYVRYTWFSDDTQPLAHVLAPATAQAALQLPHRAELIGAPTTAQTVANGLTLLNGRPALIAVAPIEPEDDAARLQLRDPHAVRYLAAVTMLDADAIARLGHELDLHDLSLTADERADSPALATLRFPTSSRPLYLRWRDEKPGSAAFASQIGPVLLGLLGVAFVTFLVARVLVAQHIRAAAAASSALESSRLKSEFIANISHELRTPLNAIVGYTELIDEESPHGGAWDYVRRDLRQISQAAFKLRQLINDVIDHSRADAGTLPLSPEPLVVNDLFAEIEDLLTPAAAANQNALAFAATPAGLEIVADHNRLRQCIVQLVGNAIKFTRNGAVSVSAREASVRGMAFIDFEIDDNGIGVADMTKLFKPSRGETAGGLGLTVARRMAQAMGGDISCVSAPGKGSRFTLRVPKRPPMVATAAA